MSFADLRRSDFDHDDDDNQAPPAQTVRIDPADILATTVLDAALTSRMKRLLGNNARRFAVIVHAPSTDWVNPISAAFKKRFPHFATSIFVKEQKGTFVDDLVGTFAHGRSVAAVSADPQKLINARLLGICETVLIVNPPTPSVLRKAIQRITGTRTLRRLMPTNCGGLEFHLLASALRPGEKPAKIIERLRRMTAAGPATPVEETAPDDLAPVPAIDQLPLTAPVRRWAEETLADMQAVKLGALPPGALTFGILEGPPGTGKTLLAQSLAATAGWSFLPTSMGAWFSKRDGHLGNVTKGISEFINELLECDFSVGFIDEVDGIPDRTTLDARAREWWTPVVNHTLTEIDRVSRSGKPILLLGATNFYDRLDAALVRPGRLHRRIPVLPPSTDVEVVDLLRFYVGDAVPLEDLDRIAHVGYGATPAMVEGWVKEAMRLARSEQRTMRAEDILLQAAPQDTRSGADVRTAALHELGHAAVAARVGVEVGRISIVPNGGSGGRTETRLTTTAPTLDQLEALATVALGGRAADIVLGAGANAGAEGDLASATHMLAAARERQGLYGELVVRGGDLGLRADQNSRAIDADLRRLLARAIAIVEADSATILHLADMLVEKLVLTGDEVVAALRHDDDTADLVHRKHPTNVCRNDTVTAEDTPPE